MPFGSGGSIVVNKNIIAVDVKHKEFDEVITRSSIQNFSSNFHGNVSRRVRSIVTDTFSLPAV